MKILRYFFTIALPLALFIFITVNVVDKNIASFDSHIYQLVSKHISSGLTKGMIFISFLGSGAFFTALAAVFIVISIINNKFSFSTAVIIINLVLSWLLNAGIKYIIHRDRPDILKLIEIGGFSFPSGHSMVSMSFYGLIIYLCQRNIKSNFKYIASSILSVLIMLIGLSRIYLGVHYASDVLGGFSFGIFWVGLFSIIIDMKYRKKQADAK